MNNIVTLETIDAKLNAVLVALAPSALAPAGVLVTANREAPHPANPRITSQQVTKFDNIEIQSDGSVWDLALDRKTPLGMVYGFLTPEKDPVAWDACVRAVMGRSETTYEAAEAWLIELRGDPWNRFKMSPEIVMTAADDQAYTRLGEMLSNPLPTPR